MKKTIILKSIIAAMLLVSSATVLLAQTTTAPTCPLGHEPGYGRSLTPEQRTAQRAVVQQLVNELRGKRAAGAITAEELAFLDQIEKRGGMCINGVPRGPGAGRGPANGSGLGQRRGLRDGTGPRCANGTCAQGNTLAKGGGQ